MADMKEIHERVEEAMLNARTTLMEYADKLEQSAFHQEPCYREEWYKLKHHAEFLVDLLDNYETVLNSMRWKWE